jgi:hypothetical protein
VCRRCDIGGVAYTWALRGGRPPFGAPAEESARWRSTKRLHHWSSGPWSLAHQGQPAAASSGWSAPVPAWRRRQQWRARAWPAAAPAPAENGRTMGGGTRAREPVGARVLRSPPAGRLLRDAARGSMPLPRQVGVTAFPGWGRLQPAPAHLRLVSDLHHQWHGPHVPPQAEPCPTLREVHAIPDFESHPGRWSCLRRRAGRHMLR